MRTQFDTTTARSVDIFAVGKVYEVPPYQRNYAWGTNEWELLWADMTPLKKGTATFHYMGPLLFQEDDTNNDRFFVIDGQQRLATLSLLALAAVHRFEIWADEALQDNERRANFERAAIFRRRFIGEKDPTALYYRTYLKLNKIDDPFFQDILNDQYKNQRPVLSSLPASHKQLYQCYKFFVKKIEREFDDSKDLAIFLDKIISQRLLFTRILVADEANAYLIFETLNARGVELAPNDLIKNYIFSLLERHAVPQDDIERLLSKWDDVLHDLGPREFVRFLRSYLNSQVSPVVRRERIFWHVKQRVRTSDNAQLLIKDLKEKSALYSALKDPSDDFWNMVPRQQQVRFYLRQLSLFNVRQHIPIIFSMYDAVMGDKFPWSTFERLLRYVTIIAFRYNTIGQRNPNQMEKVYNEIAVQLRQGAISSWQEIQGYLSQLYVLDNEFVQAFANVEFKTRRNRQLIKYILLFLEEYCRQPDSFRFENQALVLQVDNPHITIEHILPQSYTDHWGAFSSRAHKSLAFRLGNLTLLEDNLNRDAMNKPFDDKRTYYQQSQYILTREVSDLETWTPEALRERQHKLARHAAHIWRLSFSYEEG